MMKRSISLVTALCLLSLCACAAPGGRAVSPASADGEMGSSVSFTDSLGSTITLEEAPQRVAALIGSYAETWVLAGGEDTLAAVTQDAYDERGLELGEDVTNVGSNQTPELEALFAAQPDLVLLTPDLDGQLALAEPLAAAGIPAAWFKVEAFSDYLSMLEICTRLTGRDDLYQANGLDIQAEIDRALARVPEGEHPTVLLLRAYSTGNIADSDSGLLEEIQMESILAADPDHIFVTTMGSSTEKALDSLTELFHSDPAWESLAAVKEGRVHILDKALFHYKPNVRWGESYEVLADILYGGA